ncbi:GNAT family N-acetyltransferase [Neobacillus niacini]|uniref:GNAT family N-acetyltransferase n=1 Tax=Neobacillus niacini TaxID=86668 RepID=UPI00052FC921|nr:GNAT family N-acetyltransferase [Neobacillus niacini]KGM44658.1 GCN5 family acetyltransferase [Neobacillus niacini]MEC1524298.1 GNAT family N-acetyltransferase [Neobacillus niacini]
MKNIRIRQYQEDDFTRIQELNQKEGWSNLVEKNEETKEAWKHSNVSLVVEAEDDGIVGYIRGFTDTRITLYICELLIDKNYRGTGIGRELLRYVHAQYPSTRMELLASSTSHTFYEGQGYRPFYGFRKTFEE